MSRNFRFDTNSATLLEFESRRKGISLNSLVNNIFRKYSEFDRLADRTDMITLDKYLFQVLIDLIPESTLSEAAFEFGKRTGPDTLLFWKKDVTRETLREYLANILCEYCGLAEYDLTPGTDTYVLTHELGSHGTAFLRAYIEGVIAGATDKRATVEGIGQTIRVTLDTR